MLRDEIHYLGSYDEEYARHRVIQSGLRALGLEIAETRDRGFLPLRWWRLSRAALRAGRDQPLIVGESGNFLTPVLWVAKLSGRTLIFDTFVSLRDTLLDRHRLLGRPLSQVGRVLDVANCYAANLVLVDTKQALEHFASDLGITRSKLEVVYVGAETDLFTPSPLPREDAQLHVLFYGSFIPLHGIEVVLRAAAVLQDRRANITLQLVGSGQEYRRMRLIARRLRLGNVEFGPARVAYDELPELISRADVCLGVFADRPKTMRVIPHKVFQSAACGRPVVTADTPAIREIFSDVTLALVDPGNPIALADELTALAGDRPRRAALAHAASSLVRDQYSPTAIAARLLDRFSRL